MRKWLILCGLLVGCGSTSDETSEPPHPCPAAVDAHCDEQVTSGAIPESERGTCVAATLRECSTNYYLRGYEALSQPDCASGSLAPVNANVDLVLFRSSLISDSRVVVEGNGLQRYWEPHALWFFTNTPSQKTSVNHIMVGSRAQFESALRSAGIDPYAQLTPEQEAQGDKIVADIMFAPLRQFMAAQAQPAAHAVNVVIVSSIIDPALAPLIGINGELAGLGLSPALLDSVTAADPQRNLYELIGLPASFTPTLFVGDGTVKKYTAYPDNLVAHEMGHALGLVHQQAQGNLMTQGSPTTCRTTVTDTQLGEITLPQVVELAPGYETLLSAPHRVLEALRGTPR